MGVRLAFIGYGEVGSTFARDLLANGADAVVAYDILFQDGAAGGAMQDRVRADGATPVGSLAEAVAAAPVVLSAVTADAAEAVARDAARVLRPGQVFFDLNSASPSTKVRAARAVEASGAQYVEGAVMAPVAEPRLHVPILGGGPAAQRLAEMLNPLGMNIRAVAIEHGRASATKLCRSIMIKGLEALIIDCAEASARWGVQDDVFESLRQTFPSIDWPALARTMKARVERHGRRRAAEMREAGEMMTALGLDPGLCEAIAGRHDEVARRRGSP
jgi:3-hydroxyisobutyrate dehydrogenase-like beta-hydroxyacid dehydrogenase